jgi:hypothetical protein
MIAFASLVINTFHYDSRHASFVFIPLKELMSFLKQRLKKRNPFSSPFISVSACHSHCSFAISFWATKLLWSKHTTESYSKLLQFLPSWERHSTWGLLLKVYLCLFVCAGRWWMSMITYTWWFTAYKGPLFDVSCDNSYSHVGFELCWGIRMYKTI